MKTLALIGLLPCAISNSYAQDKHSQQNYHPGIPYSISDIENINLTNGNLMFDFNFGTVKGRGTAMSGLSLKYNSKLYESHVQTTLDNSGREAPQLFLRESNEGGWMYDDDYRIKVISRNDDLDRPHQPGGGCTRPDQKAVYVWKLMMYFPDGSQHEFRPTGYSDERPDLQSDGYYNVDTGGLRTYLSWASDSSASCPGGTVYSVRVVTNRDPNPKMTYYSTDGTHMRLEIPNGQSARDPHTWTLYMPDGSRVVSDVNANGGFPPTKLYDKNGNFVSGTADELGRYISRVAVSPTEDHIQRLGVNGEPLIWKVRWKYITITRQYTTSGTQEIGRCCYSSQVLRAQPKVVDEIELPSQLGALKHKFTYNAHEGRVNYDPNNPNYSPGWGEVTSVTLPSGAKVEYYINRLILPQMDTNMLLPRLGKVSGKRLIHNKEYDGSSSQTTDTWTYSISQSGTAITGPDGGVSAQSFYRTDTDNDLSGRVYKETKPDGTIAERIWTNNKVGGCPAIGCGSMRRLNAFIKTEFTTIPDAWGNPSLTAIKDFDYDKNGNVTKITEYDWVPYSGLPRDSVGKVSGIPGGVAPIRFTENAYYNQTEHASNSTANNGKSYWNPSAPNVRRALSSTTVKNGSGAAVSRSEFNYFDVDTTANLIETKAWDSVKGAYSNPLTASNSISSTVQYDQYGNPTLTTDAKGNRTQITYGDIVTPTGTVNGLYPTEVISPYETQIARTSSAAYDFYAGLVARATDVDNDVSVVTEYDALGRPTKVRKAARTPLESWTRTEYNDAARRVIVRSDIETTGDGKKVAVRHYDQLGRVRLSRSIENVLTEDPYNEAHGIKVETRYQTDKPNSYQLTSNPFRAATATAATDEPSMGWTRSKSWNTGRKQEVETFSGSALPAPWGSNANSTGVVTTETDAERTLVTDQVGKQRISRTSALGQLKDVWEVTASDSATEAISFPTQALSAGYRTSYGYDTLNNLTTVSQGVQTRSFTYDSLSRLLSATNPESGLMQYVYDNNGNLTKKTDARGIETNYSYDALNRVIQRTYANEPKGQETPDVSYFYDNLPNAKGKLTKVSSSVSTTEYTAFDTLGRVLSHEQTTDGQNYRTGYTYNLSGGLIEETYASGRVVKNVVDIDGDLSLVQSKKNQNFGYDTYASSFTYTAAGAVGSMQLGNGKWESTQFNSRLQPTQIALGTVQSGTDKLKLDYSYDTTTNNGNVQSQTMTVPTVGSNQGFTATQTYTYDSLNRLKDAKEAIGTTQTWKQTFVYDRYGNRNFDTTNNNTTTLGANCPIPVCNPTVDTGNNRLNSYMFDNSGNTTGDAENRTFVYDAENKQVEVREKKDTIIGQYVYDGDGKRVKKIVANGETVIFVYDAAGKLVAEYANQISQTPQVSYLTSDHLGSPRITTDATGQVVSRRDFDPFGEEVGTAQRTNGVGYKADSTRQKFAGYERDNETNLDFAQARYFNSGFGRFSRPDPFGPWAMTEKEKGEFYSEPQKWNLYVYVTNNPLTYSDPTGFERYDSKTVSKVDEEKIRKGLKAILKYGTALQKQIVRNIQQSELLIQIATNTGNSGSTGVANTMVTQGKIDSQRLNEVEALGELTIIVDSGTLATQKGIEGTLVHETRHAFHQARAISEFSQADEMNRQAYDPDGFAIEYAAHKSYADYVIQADKMNHPDKQAFVNEAVGLGVVNKNGNVSGKGITDRLNNYYKLNSTNNRGQTFSQHWNLTPRNSW